MSELKILTSESVGRGHPDKVCDSISDAVLDAVLYHDPKARVALETAVKAGVKQNLKFAPLYQMLGSIQQYRIEKNGFVGLFGELTTSAKNLDLTQIVHYAVKRIGYVHDEGFNNECLVLPMVGMQSPDIAMGVDSSEEKEQGAGDQGLMWGYANSETKQLMPLGLVLAHGLVQRLEQARESGLLPYLRPDTKSQVAVVYNHLNQPVGLKNVVIAASHDSKVDMDQLKNDVLEYIIKPVCGDWLNKDTAYHINATGRFEVHGPVGDSGVTGRKIIVDTYGGVGRHGGGAFSGKDPSKVDRSAAYLARYVAKNIVAAGLAKECEVQLSYCIGVAEPTSVQVNTFKTGIVDDSKLVRAVREVMPLKPAQIISGFRLTKPEGWSYFDTAAYGHFGDSRYPWEQTNGTRDLYESATR